MSDQISPGGSDGAGAHGVDGEPARSSTASRRATPATVVVADDDDAFRETLLLWLSDAERWETREASNGEEALDRLDDAVDVLVLDRGMPKLSGPEVVDRLPATPFEGATVVLSADGPDEHLAEDAVARYLLKPIDRERFLDQLERCLR